MTTMTTMTADEKVQAGLKRALMGTLIDEYVRSDFSNFYDFYSAFIYSGHYYNLGDEELVRMACEYNDSNNMNEALE